MVSALLATVLCVLPVGPPPVKPAPPETATAPPSVAPKIVPPPRTEAAGKTPAAGDPAPDQNAAEPKAAPSGVPEGATDLLASGLSRDVWFRVSGKADAEGPATWGVRRDGDGTAVLTTTGQPFGYLRTVRGVDNFDFGLEWRTPAGEPANTGVLIHTGEDRVWPDAVQVQLHGAESGSIFPLGAAQTDGELRRVNGELNGPNKWNACIISSDGGSLSVSINGQTVGRLTGCRPVSGYIALQSEGSAVEFRRVWMRPRPSTAAQARTPAEAEAPTKTGDPAIADPAAKDTVLKNTVPKNTVPTDPASKDPAAGDS